MFKKLQKYFYYTWHNTFLKKKSTKINKYYRYGFFPLFSLLSTGQEGSFLDETALQVAAEYVYPSIQMFKFLCQCRKFESSTFSKVIDILLTNHVEGDMMSDRQLYKLTNFCLRHGGKVSDALYQQLSKLGTAGQTILRCVKQFVQSRPQKNIPLSCKLKQKNVG